MEGEGGKGLLGSGVENCGICLNGVREVIGGYCGTWLEGFRMVMGMHCGTWQEG